MSVRQARHALAEALAKEGRLSEAVDAVKSAVDEPGTSPASWRLHHVSAQWLRQSGVELEACVAYLRSALTGADDAVVSEAIDYASALEFGSLQAEALREVAGASVGANLDRRVIHLIGLLFRLAGESDEALQHLGPAADDMRPETRQLLASLLLDTDQLDEAEEILHGLADTPNTELTMIWAELELLRGRFAECVDLLDGPVTPTTGQARRRGQQLSRLALVGLGRGQEATEIELPDDPQFGDRMAVALSHLAAGNYDEAGEHLRLATPLYPDSLSLALFDAQVRLEEGKDRLDDGIRQLARSQSG